MWNTGKTARVVRINNYKCWTTSEGKQISGVQATVLLHVDRGTTLGCNRFNILPRLQKDASKVVAYILWLRADWEGTISG